MQPTLHECFRPGEEPKSVPDRKWLDPPNRGFLISKDDYIGRSILIDMPIC